LDASGSGLDALVAGAARRAGLDPGRARGFARRARLAALLPEVRVAVARSLRYDESLATALAQPEQSRIGAADNLAFEVRALWRLDRLAAHPQELAAGRDAVAASHALRALEAEVIQAYFRALRARQAAARAGPDERWQREIDAREAAARLAALTGRLPLELVPAPLEASPPEEDAVP